MLHTDRHVHICTDMAMMCLLRLLCRVCMMEHRSGGRSVVALMLAAMPVYTVPSCVPMYV